MAIQISISENLFLEKRKKKKKMDNHLMMMMTMAYHFNNIQQEARGGVERSFVRSIDGDKCHKVSQIP